MVKKLNKTPIPFALGRLLLPATCVTFPIIPPMIFRPHGHRLRMMVKTNQALQGFMGVDTFFVVCSA